MKTRLSLCISLIPTLIVCSLRAEEKFADEGTVTDAVFALAEKYFDEFQHPETGVLYGGRLEGRSKWTSPADILAEKPHPWGYGSHIEDTSLHNGHVLAALLDANSARTDPFLQAEIRQCFEGLKLIGSLPETHPKPGKPALVGLVPRGPHADDLSAWYDDSSMDQHTTYIISLALFSQSNLATEEDKEWIRQSLGKVGRRLESNDWSIKRADGETQAHVGFSWKSLSAGHASILLPTVLALHVGTGDEHWRERYEAFLSEADQKRWKLSHPGPHVKINNHPIYANQNAFRVNAWYQLESSPERKKVVQELLAQSAEMQLARDFPGEMFRKLRPNNDWDHYRQAFQWDDAELRGAAVAWSKFRPEHLKGKDGGIGALAHVRFPLGGYHMVLQSEDPELIREHLPTAWAMLSTVDLEQIAAGETHYLFTVVGLHLYALYFRHAELFES